MFSWPHFKLRSALFAILVLAVLFASFACWRNAAIQQQKLVERHREVGTAVGYKVDPNSLQGKVADQLGIDMVATPRELILNSTKPERINIDDIVATESTTFLALNCTGVVDEDLARIGDMPRLQDIVLSDTDVTDKGISYLANLRLRSLHIENLGLTDASAESLARITTLKWLSLTAGTFSQTAMDRLRNALPDCTINLKKPSTVRGEQ